MLKLIKSFLEDEINLQWRMPPWAVRCMFIVQCIVYRVSHAHTMHICICARITRKPIDPRIAPKLIYWRNLSTAIERWKPATTDKCICICCFGNATNAVHAASKRLASSSDERKTSNYYKFQRGTHLCRSISCPTESSKSR